MSRGILNNVDVWFTGSMLATIMVSVKSGASWVPPPLPNNKTLMRPSPSPFNNCGLTLVCSAAAEVVPPRKTFLAFNQPCENTNPLQAITSTNTTAVLRKTHLRVAFQRLFKTLTLAGLSGLRAPGIAMSIGKRRFGWPVDGSGWASAATGAGGNAGASGCGARAKAIGSGSAGAGCKVAVGRATMKGSIERADRTAAGPRKSFVIWRLVCVSRRLNRVLSITCERSITC